MRKHFVNGLVLAQVLIGLAFPVHAQETLLGGSLGRYLPGGTGGGGGLLVPDYDPGYVWALQSGGADRYPLPCPGSLGEQGGVVSDDSGFRAGSCLPEQGGAETAYTCEMPDGRKLAAVLKQICRSRLIR